MSKVAAWFERKFQFTFPLEQYPNVCVRLRGTPARMEEMLADVPRSQLVHKPDGKWSIQEHAGHLLDLETLWMARVEDYLAAKDVLTVADLSNRKTDEADHNRRSLHELLADFRNSRNRLVSRVDELEPEFLARSVVHPRLQQPMRLVDHLFFVAEHDDHHLARMWELIRARHG